MSRLVAAMLLVITCVSCSTNDGRRLADPDPDLTRVTTTAPTATGEAARGGPASALAVPVSSTGPEGLTVSSPQFAPGAVIPVEHTCDGAGIAPTVDWRANTTEAPLALVVRDADGGGRIHWLVALEGAAGRVGGGAPAAGDEPSFTEAQAWIPPCPDDGLEHRFVFTLYTLPETFRLPPGGDPATTVRTIEGTHLGAATVLGKYARG